MGQAIGPTLAGFPQGSDVPAIRLDPPTPMAIHRAVIRIGDDDFMPHLLQVLRDPFTFGRRFYQNPHPWPAPKHMCQAFACRRDAPINEFAGLRQDLNLTFSLVEINGTILHGWSPLLRLERVFALWSGSYHVTKEASRFILSSGSATTLQSWSS